MATDSYGFLGDREDTRQRITALRQVPLFRHLNDDHVSAIARHAYQAATKPGDVLVREGEEGHDFVVILDGTVRVERNGQKLAELGPGNYFGELALLDSRPRSATVVADSPGEVILMDRALFLPLLDEFPGLERQLLLDLAARLRARDEDPTG